MPAAMAATRTVSLLRMASINEAQMSALKARCFCCDIERAPHPDPGERDGASQALKTHFGAREMALAFIFCLYPSRTAAAWAISEAPGKYLVG